jgi:serine/threonine-protein kinase
MGTAGVIMQERMSETDLQRLEGIFQTAVELSPDERTAYLDRACADEPMLRDHVERLLDNVEKDESLVAPGPFPAAAITEGPGTVIGRYKLLQVVGEGGFGVVYMAEQTEPVVRKVALKIIKLGMDTRQVVARFEAERQALALMDHPNIARVLDGGATASGRPYFVMELVRGLPVTEYCDTNNLGTHERLELFCQVCHAVQHAHQKGVIHRDLKPSNVLVTLHDGTPIPKVIDFGVAKAMHTKLTEKTLFTRYEQFIGTPAYMSPEQAELSAMDVDTRTDIYSLGVLLYELLTGTTPFDTASLMKAGIAEIQRIIRDEQPPRPSIRISTSAPLRDRQRARRRRAPPPAERAGPGRPARRRLPPQEVSHPQPRRGPHGAGRCRSPARRHRRHDTGHARGGPQCTACA